MLVEECGKSRTRIENSKMNELKEISITKDDLFSGLFIDLLKINTFLELSQEVREKRVTKCE